MNYLLDTNIIIAILRGNYEVQRRTYTVGLQKCFLPDIALAELYIGAHKSGKEQAFKQLAAVENLFQIVPISPSLKTYARLRAELESKGTRLDDIDLMIAATAIANDMTLISNNTRHFERVPGLKLADFVR